MSEVNWLSYWPIVNTILIILLGLYELRKGSSQKRIDRIRPFLSRIRPHLTEANDAISNLKDPVKRKDFFHNLTQTNLVYDEMKVSSLDIDLKSEIREGLDYIRKTLEDTRVIVKNQVKDSSGKYDTDTFWDEYRTQVASNNELSLLVPRLSKKVDEWLKKHA